MSGGRSPRRKGSGFEREVVNLFQSLGIAAERVPLSGAVKGGNFDRDITAPDLSCPVAQGGSNSVAGAWRGHQRAGQGSARI